MKKKILLPLITLLLTSCNNAGNISNLKILVPTGAPAVAFYDYLSNDNFTSVGTPANIVSDMTSNGSDIIVIDTIKGVQAINAGAPYKLAANITFGNFFIASTGNDDNNSMDITDDIVIFGKNQTPDKVFNYIYGSEYNLHYVDSVQDGSKCLISGKTLDLTTTVDYVFIAQPVLTNALSKNTNASIYANIQDLYTEKSNLDMIQAAIFVKNSANTDDINAFLDDINEDINSLLNDPDLLISKTEGLDEQLVSSKIGVNVTLANKVLKNNNGIGLGFKYVSENKNSVNEFLKLFNLSISDENIYQR